MPATSAQPGGVDPSCGEFTVPCVNRQGAAEACREETPSEKLRAGTELEVYISESTNAPNRICSNHGWFYSLLPIHYCRHQRSHNSVTEVNPENTALVKAFCTS